MGSHVLIAVWIRVEDLRETLDFRVRKLFFAERLGWFIVIGYFLSSSVFRLLFKFHIVESEKAYIFGGYFIASSRQGEKISFFVLIYLYSSYRKT